MQGPARSAQSHSFRRTPRRGYTLVEILVATALTLLLMGAVVQIFASIGGSVADSRSTVEMSDRLRGAAARLQMDLVGLTVTMRPPRHPADDEGYFEYTEGPIGPEPAPALAPIDTDDPANPVTDTTVGDIDDNLMFTTRSTDRPFVGRADVSYHAIRWPCVQGNSSDANGADQLGRQITVFEVSPRSVESQVAEVAWFIRGRTLYRRVLLIQPALLDADLRTPEPEFPAQFENHTDGGSNYLPPQVGFYSMCDISVHLESSGLVANTLGDLTKRENRFAHQSPDATGGMGFPNHPHVMIDNSGNVVRSNWASLGLPTLRECSYVHPQNPATESWIAGAFLPLLTLTAKPSPDDVFDAWVNPHPWQELDPTTGAYINPSLSAPPPPDLPPYMGSRIAEDVILTNVIGFDVKAWDPQAPVILDTKGNSDPNDDVVYEPGDPDYFAKLDDVGGNCVVASRGAYVDLDYTNNGGNVVGGAAASPVTSFSGPPHWRSGFSNPTSGVALIRVYDTWSSHYEHDGYDQDDNGTLADEGTDGFDNDGVNGVDDPGECETLPPYSVPLRGIRVRIRVFEPDSRQIREVTVVQDFLPK